MKKKVRLWIYIVSFLVSAGFPIANLLSFDLKRVLVIILFAAISSFIFGSIINLLLNLRIGNEEKEKQEE